MYDLLSRYLESLYRTKNIKVNRLLGVAAAAPSTHISHTIAEFYKVLQCRTTGECFIVSVVLTDTNAAHSGINRGRGEWYHPGEAANGCLLSGEPGSFVHHVIYVCVCWKKSCMVPPVTEAVAKVISKVSEWRFCGVSRWAATNCFACLSESHDLMTQVES